LRVSAVRECRRFVPQGLTGGSDASAVGSRNASRSASPMLAPADSGASAPPAEPERSRPAGGGLGLHVNVHGTSSGAGPATVSEGDGVVRRAVTAPGKAGRRSSIAAMPSAPADGGDDDISDLLGLGDFGPPVERVDPAKARQAHTRERAVGYRRAFIGRGHRRAFIGRGHRRAFIGRGLSPGFHRPWGSPGFHRPWAIAGLS
jgi:hypothetical protein